MSDQKKPIWITIPDETAAPKRLPAERKSNSGQVNNKAFWAAGFFALIVFSGMLLMPQQVSQLMKAQLFDGDFQVVPDFEEQQDTNEFFGDDENAESATEEEADSEASQEEPAPEPVVDNVVEAEADAVSIQIEPITDPEEIVVELEADTEVEAEAESEPVEVGTVEADSPSAPEQPELSDDVQGFLQNLQDQLDQLQADTESKDAEIAALNAQLHGSADEFGLPNQDFPNFVEQLPTTTPKVEVMSNGSVYRYNTHTVTVNPHDILAQNKQLSMGVQAGQVMQGNIQQSVQSYGSQNYNPVLSGVQAQPGTGPAEAMLAALVLCSVAVLGFGVFRTVRA